MTHHMYDVGTAVSVGTGSALGGFLSGDVMGIAYIRETGGRCTTCRSKYRYMAPVFTKSQTLDKPVCDGSVKENGYFSKELLSSVMFHLLPSSGRNV